MERQNVPLIAVVFPATHVFPTVELPPKPTVDVEIIERTPYPVVSSVGSRPSLFVACRFNRVFETAALMTERVTEGRNLHFHPVANQTLGLFGFVSRIVSSIIDWTKVRAFRAFVRHGVTPNFMSPARHILQRPDVGSVPFYLSPWSMGAVIQMYRAVIRGDEEGCRKTVLIEDRDTTLYLAAESVIECQRYNLHWFIVLEEHLRTSTILSLVNCR